MKINLEEIRFDEENTVIPYTRPHRCIAEEKHRALVGWMDGEGLVHDYEQKERYIYIYTYIRKRHAKKINKR